MKIDRAKLKKSSSEVPPDCRLLVEKIRGCNEKELHELLKSIKSWNYGKCELYHWIDVLDLFDSILAKCCHKERETQWTLPVDLSSNSLKELCIPILQFTALLIEHSFSKHVYNSMEHLTTLLSSSDMQIVLSVLNLLYVFSKRSNFITRSSPDRRKALMTRLNYLAESWGGKENGFGLAECCQELKMSSYPLSATTLHFEYYCDESGPIPHSFSTTGNKKSPSSLNVIHIENVDNIKDKTIAQVMEDLLETHHVPKEKQMLLFTHLRLAHNFSNYRKRLHCVQARLQALSIIVHSNAMSMFDNANNVLYNGFIEELVDVLELKELKLLDIKAAALRTLTSVIHLDHTTQLNTIIDVTGAASYHGFLPTLVRSCIQALIDGNTNQFPISLATALFSFLYHLASYENGGEALVSCGMIESLLKVVSWTGSDPEHITFVTRAVRVIDLITNLDMNAFQSHGGLSVLINRLEYEVDICRKECPFEIDVGHQRRESQDGILTETASLSSVDALSSEKASSSSAMEVENVDKSGQTLNSSYNRDLQIYPQRAAVLKSMFNFLKKAIQDPSFSDSIRHLMDGPLPKCLRHIISNAEYYGPYLFMLATDVVTVYVFQEPSLLSSLQESGLTDVVLHALLVKEIPATREVIASLPNVFSALCLNTRGLEAFTPHKPFEKIFKLLLSPDYLPAMRRRRSNDPMVDTASNLGSAMDELMRHQPSLRAEATSAIIKLLKELCELGSDPNFVCSKPAAKGPEANAGQSDSIRPVMPGGSAEAGSSDEEDEEDEETTTAPPTGSLIVTKPVQEQASTSSAPANNIKQPVPLVDYILHVMRLIDAILSNNSTDDHCREFVKQKGLEPLLNILRLPNLPIDFPLTPACLSVSSVCKSLQVLTYEREVLKLGLTNLNEVLNSLEPLHQPLPAPGGSVLLEELVQATMKAQGTGCDPLQSATLTPLLHHMSAAHAYIIMFVHVCRTGQPEIRNLTVTHWGSDIGLNVLKGLSQLYTSLVWESTVLLALCSDSTATVTWKFGRHQVEKLAALSKDADSSPTGRNYEENKMEIEESCDGLSVDTEISKKKDVKTPKPGPQMKQIKPLLSSASRLGRALAELFGLLVKLCVNSPLRHRRNHHSIPTIPVAPFPAARSVATHLTKLLAKGLSWTPPPTSPIPKFRLTFYTCSVGFTSPMLFDERKFPYHLMLQKFVQCGGQDAFFDTFHWALTQGGKVPISEGLEHPNVPDGTGEFLDSWLMLLEKMVNPKMVLESPHTMVTKTTQPNFVPFDPVKYLVKTHKKAFECVMHLWNKKPLKVYGERMSESVLAIFCHLLKGEVIILEKLSKEKDTEVKESTSTTTTSARTSRRTELEEQGISSEHLQQLIDMGFARELALEALVHAASLEQATDYLLSHPSLTRSGGSDWEMSEEDQVIRAIAMSLDDNVNPDNPAEGTSQTPTDKEDEPMSKETIDEFTNELLPGCLKLLDTLPETVHRVCDLLLAVCHRNSEKWTEQMLNQLIQEISLNVDKLLESAQPMTSSDKRSIPEWASQISQLPEAYKSATRIHLFSLLFEEKRNQCAALISETNLINNLVQLLESAQNALLLTSSNKPPPVSTPKWLAPAILLIDLYDKSAIASARRAPLLALPKRQWKWFDDRSGKWTIYTLNNNKTIDDAYKNGESFIRFTASRRKYTVQFSTMIQINEETGNWRPIMFVCDDKAMEVTEEAASSSKVPTPNYVVVKGLEPYQCTALIRACTGFIGIPVDPETLHAVMRLVLRLTRNYEQASIFEELGGVRSILKLTQVSGFTGFTSLASLIIRHVMEDPNTLRYAMERVIRATLHNPTITCKEMHYILRVLGPAACRNKDLFIDITKSILRISLYPQSKREEDESRILSAQAVQTLRLLPSKQPGSVNLSNNIIKEVIYDLLNALTVNTYGLVQDESPNSSEKTVTNQSSAGVSYCPVLARGIARESSSSDLVQQDDDEITVHEEPVSNSGPTDKASGQNAKDEEALKKSRPLLNQSCIMRLLAELIRSYPLVAKLIADHVYHAGHNDLISEECSALSFILDHLLPNTQNFGDKNCPALTRVLIAALSSSNHCPEAQTSLVNEVKSALNRALALAESNEKHIRVQAILGIINTMIDSCPAVAQNPQSQTIQGSFRGQTTGLNNMVKIMLRRGIVNDLARITHSLDFSSPHMALTVNAALKPLETLSKIINLPTSIFTQAKRPKTGNVSSSNTEAMEEDTVASGGVDPMSNLVSESTEGPTTEASGNVGPEILDMNNEILNQQSNNRTYDNVEDNTDNEAVVIEEGIHFDVYNDSHSRSSNLIDEVIRNEHNNVTMEPEENHDNVNNSNGAESESDDESDSDDEDEDEDDEDQSNADEEERDEEDEDEDEDDHVDEDDVEDDEISAYVNQEDIDDSVLRNYERDSEHLVFDIEDMIPASVFTEGSLRLTTILPMLENEQLSNTADATQPSVPPAPGSVSISHPLLVRPGDIGDAVGMNPASASTTASILASRPHRSNRQRMYRPPVSSSSGAAHANWTSGIANRHPNPPVILQRLLGPSTAQQILQLTSVAGAGSSSVLGSIPSAMLRWTEESRVLDGESMHDCVASLKMSIIEVWEKYRDEELAERKEKRKNMLEEEEKPKKKMARDKNEKNGAKEPETRPSIVDDNTQRLAASIVEQVLGPVMASTNITGRSDSHRQSAIRSSDRVRAQPEDLVAEVRSDPPDADPDADSEAEADADAEAEAEPEVEDDHSSSPSPSNDTTSVQNDNEITEMICSLSTREEENPRPMDIDENRRSRNPRSSRDDPPPPPERASSSDGLPAVGAITPEDLSTVTNSSSEGNATSVTDEPITQPGNSENKSEGRAPGPSAPQAPEPDNTVEVANGEGAANSTSTGEIQQPSGPAGSSNNNSELQNLLGDTELPEGVDPSFLAALPENIRQEVIADQLRAQRIQQQRAAAAAAAAVTANQPSSSQPSSVATTPSTAAGASGTVTSVVSASGEASVLSEVNPEFLAALPPNIQEEVLAQQRAEQQRLQAQSTSPDAPVDPASFIQTLPPGLRRQVLADMDDSLLALLPLDLASEAQNLRQELEARHRQFSERFLASHATTTLSRILRSASGRTRYAISTAQGGNWLWDLGARGTNSSTYGTSSGHPHQVRPPFPPGRFKGRQLLDHEALCCLLILLFVDEPKLNVCRLQRVLKNLCHHNATRIWVINSLLAIMEKTRDPKDFVEPKTRKSSSGSILNKSSNQSSSWLSISLDAALGCRTNVFQILRGSGGKKGSSQVNHSITIHPQAAPLVCRHVLDTLISLAKSFPQPLRADSLKEEQKLSSSSQSSRDDSSCNKSCKDPDFWEVLLRLDSSNSTKKGKSVIKSHSSSPYQSSNQASNANDSDAASQDSDSSPLVQIINLLSHPVVKRSSLLTDKLLRLLSLVALGSLPPTDSSSYYAGSTSQSGEQSGIVNEGAPSAIQIPSEKPKSKDTKEDKTENPNERKLVINEDAIKLAVEVLTSKSCSEAGLEDATSLLLRLSRSCPATRDIVLNLLLEGARELGFTVSQHITKLNQELRKLNISSREPSDDNSDANADKHLKGMIQDRFTAASIVINAATHIKHTSASKEVQLPSMAALTSKTSSQSFFLRILKVIVQLRESIRMQKFRGRLAPSTGFSQPLGSSEGSSIAASGNSDGSSTSNAIENSPEAEIPEQESLSSKLNLNTLWECLSNCLLELADAPDHHAVLVLQPAVEAFFLVHASEKEPKRRRENRHESRETQLAHVNQDLSALSPMIENSSGDSAYTVSSNLPVDTQKFLQFAETHRVVLNQILRQSTTPLANGPFSVLVDHTRVLDFDVKRRYFRQELERMENGARREDLPVHVRREHVFEDSFRELYRRSTEEWKNRFYIVFEGEEGQDAGGLLREWYTIISREIFNPMYALFTTSPGDRVTYMINSASHCNSNHLQYFKFVGRVIAKAIYDNKLLECYFTRSFYKHILGKLVNYHDMESEDYSFYRSLVFLLEHDVKELDIEQSFSLEVQEFGVTEIRDLKPNGRNIEVTEENKHEYVRLVCQEKMTGSIRKQLSSFLEGFYEIIPKRLISIFNEQELELLISGLPNIDIDDLKANCEYHKYQANSLQIQWFWRALRSFDQADRAKFLQFVTGTSKVPLQGFSALEGMNGTQRFQIHRDDRSTDRLPSAHTCFNQLDLPAYETYDKLKTMLMKAIHECSEGFGFA